MTWADPTGDLQKFLSDQATDKLRHRQRVIGYQDGVKKVFKTLEFRRVTDFTTAVAPFGVYVNGAIATVDSDDTATGEFTLHTAPGSSDEVVATFYIQWFTSIELALFLKESSNFLSLSDSYDQVPPGLVPAALNFAASCAYQKLALRWADHIANGYQLRDAPDNDFKPVEQYTKLSEMYRKGAVTLRDDFYTRQGQYKAPLYNTLAGRVPRTVPNR